MNIDNISHINFLNVDMENLKIIPSNWQPTRFFSFSFEGFLPFTFSATCPSLMDSVSVAESALFTFINLYKETHAFTEPQLVYRPNQTVISVKTGVMTLEEYEVRSERQNIEQIK